MKFSFNDNNLLFLINIFNNTFLDFSFNLKLNFKHLDFIVSKIFFLELWISINKSFGFSSSKILSNEFEELLFYSVS